MSHTPGPWKLEDFSGEHKLSNGGFAIVCAANGWVICGRAEWTNRAEMRADNARLIAASPSMYSALQMAHSYFASHSTGNNEASEHFRRIGAILAQVEGRDAAGR